jgi:hypothetical protein
MAFAVLHRDGKPWVTPFCEFTCVGDRLELYLSMPGIKPSSSTYMRTTNCQPSKMKSLAALVGLALLVGADALFTGPNSNLYIKNKYIQPDGFNRSYVLQHSFNSSVDKSHLLRTVLAGITPGTIEFPGPLITGLKVHCSIPPCHLLGSTHISCRGTPSASMSSTS